MYHVGRWKNANHIIEVAKSENFKLWVHSQPGHDRHAKKLEKFEFLDPHETLSRPPETLPSIPGDPMNTLRTSFFLPSGAQNRASNRVFYGHDCLLALVIYNRLHQQVTSQYYIATSSMLLKPRISPCRHLEWLLVCLSGVYFIRTLIVRYHRLL